MKIGIAVVLGALVLALYFFLSSGSSSDSSDSRSEPTPETSTSPVGRDKTTKARPITRPPPAIRHGATGDAGQVLRNYELHDGTRVTDHRDNPTEPNLDSYVVLPPGVSKVEPKTLVKVRRSLQPTMTRCIESHGQGAEEGARLQAFLTTSIQEENLRIDKVRVQISGLEASEALEKCVTEGVMGQEQSVAGARDVSAHRMVFPYDL